MGHFPQKSILITKFKTCCFHSLEITLSLKVPNIVLIIIRMNSFYFIFLCKHFLLFSLFIFFYFHCWGLCARLQYIYLVLLFAFISCISFITDDLCQEVLEWKYDEFILIFSINLNIQREFQLLGSRFISKLSFRDAWIFVGQRGIVGKSPIEEVVFCFCVCLGLTCIILITSHWIDLDNYSY